MSRRKQLNPKPLLKRDDEEVESDKNTITHDVSNMISEKNLEEEIPTHQIKDTTKIENESQNDEEENSLEIECEENSRSPLSLKILPTLRLNTSLASDPATNPDAKEIHLKSENLKSIDFEGGQNIDTESQMLISKIVCDENAKANLQKAKENISNVSNLIVKNIDLMRPNVFMCTPCGIRFSSLSTLEAHCTYYCSHRKTDENLINKNSSSSDLNGIEPPTKSIKTGKQYACSQCSYSADKKVSLNRHMRMHQTSPTASSTTSNGEEASNLITPVQQIIAPVTQTAIVDRYCSDCDIRFSSTKTYRAHKQHYCSSRHQSTSSLVPPPILPNSSSSSSVANVSTAKQPKSGSQTPETPKTPPTSSHQPFLALPTNPVIIIPYSLIRNATIIPGPLTSVAQGTSSDSACFLLQNGQLQPIAYVISQTTSSNLNSQSQTPKITSAVSENTTNSEPKNRATPLGSGEVLKSINKRDGAVISREPSTPLDLSVRRISPNNHNRERSLSLSSAISVDQFRMEFDSMMEGKENLSISGDSVTPEQIVCAPSLPGSPPLTPSPKRRRSNSPRSSSVSISPNSSSSHILMRPSLLPSDIAIRLSDPTLNVIPPLVKQSMELALRISNSVANNDGSSPVSPSQSIKSPKAANSSLNPQVFVKTGMSKCKECNIVFCKYENYVAHKKHYCSARNLEETENLTKVTSPSLPITSNNTPIIPQTYQQLICMACGVKFANRDNLNAHQTYYCPKRNELEAQTIALKEKCNKCKTIHEPTQNCAPLGSYKCPMCDVVSSNSNEARKHIETHSGVKAFKCNICQYKGNTLRGMRTHIRMHIDKNAGDFNEENFISCILENSEASNSTPAVSLKNNSDDGNKVVEQPNNTIKENTNLITLKVEPNEDVANDENIVDDSIATSPSENIMCVKSEDQNDIEIQISPNHIENSIVDQNIRTTPLGNSLYCENCEVVFNYEHTLAAHRKFYCKAIKNDKTQASTSSSISSKISVAD